MPTDQRTNSDREPDRNKHRDNDDTRGYVEGPDRNEAHPDSRSEARGDAREAVGANTQGTAADTSRDQGDQYDGDLKRDNARGREASGMEALARDTRAGMAGAEGAGGSFGREGVQHGRRTQAASPAERGHDERPKEQEGHGSR